MGVQKSCDNLWAENDRHEVIGVCWEIARDLRNLIGVCCVEKFPFRETCPLQIRRPQAKSFLTKECTQSCGGLGG